MNLRRFLPTYHYEDNTDGMLLDSAGKYLRDYKVYGNSEQNGTPTPEAPVEIESVGEKTDDGRYKIPIKVIGRNISNEPYKDLGTTNIYLDEPLRKVGNYADYVDFKNGKVVRVIKEINLSPKIIQLSPIGKDGCWYHYSTYGTYFYTFNANEYYDYNNGIASKCNSLSFKALSNSSAMTIADGEYYVFYRDTGSSIYRITINEATYNKLLEVDECYFYYPLAEPTEEVIDLPQIPTAKGTCNVVIDTEIQPSGMNWQYYRE